MARKGSAPLPDHVADPATTPPAEGDLLDRLGFEHRQIERLWSEFRLAHGRHLEAEHRPGARFGGTGQHDLARQIVTALTEHEAVELQLLYPAVEEVVGQELAYHARADHEEVRQLLDDVDGADPADEAVFQAFTKIMSKALAHIEEEERIAFPMLRAVLTTQGLRDLGQPPVRAEVPGPAGPAAENGEVIDLAGAEREQARAEETTEETTKVGLADRGRRLLRRR